MRKMLWFLVLIPAACTGPSTQPGGEHSATPPGVESSKAPPRIEIVVDYNKLKDHGLSVSELNRQINSFLREKPDASVDEMSGLILHSSAGGEVRLSEVATVSRPSRSPSGQPAPTHPQ